MRKFPFLLFFVVLIVFGSCKMNPLANKTYVYELVLSDSLGRVLSTENISVKYTEIPWYIDSTQNTFIRTYDTSSSVPEEIGIGFFCLQGEKSQLIRKVVDKSGYINNRKELWLHPIRSNQYRFSEIAPFPYIKKKNDFWNYNIHPGEGWCELEGLAQSNYSIDKKKVEVFGFRCQKVVASSTHSQGVSSVIFYYNRKKGFVLQEYKLIKGYKLNISLIK